MMKVLLIVFLSLLPFLSNGQTHFHLMKDKKNSFTFELSGNLVIVPVTLNGVNLSFLLDTGVKETMLFVSDKDSIPLENVHQVTFTGIGVEDGVEGLMALNNELIVGNCIADFGHDIFVINSNELDVSSHVGLPVHGILGSRLFESLVVQMDYSRLKMTLYNQGSKLDKITKGYKKIPISIERDRPYVMSHITFDSKRAEDAKMLIDMGNSDGMLIFPFLLDSFQVKDPSIYDYIGRGFNGEIYGKRNRIAGFEFGGFQIKEPIVSYPDSNAVHSARLAENRKGSIGSQVLQHFHLIFDYSDSQLYLKPNNKFGKKFPINMTGIEVKHDGQVWTEKRVPAKVKLRAKDESISSTKVNFEESFQYEFRLLPIYVIANVRKDSPADQAGLLKGDELLRIDGHSASEMKLKEIIGKFQQHEGKVIRLYIRRGEEEKSIEVTLKDPIPFQKS